MELLLWRHAEAEEGKDDLARPLTARGVKQALRMADWLRPRLPKHLKTYASPAKRAQQTAEALGISFKTDRRLGPFADVADLIALADWPSDGGAVLLVGHQPVLGRLASLLLAGQEADWAVKKGALWWFSSRERLNEPQVVLRGVIAPGLL
ncbi:MAG: Phosphohistidine phosphatase SixA [Betaproteobacteria bacterium ADurb.Bin341]|nr:MAG: Phosphohistidine phosphatase SixA [Betaproteobacteria bacterium ADurb.Bin341]